MKLIVIVGGVVVLAGTVIAQVKAGRAASNPASAAFKVPTMWEYSASA